MTHYRVRFLVALFLAALGATAHAGAVVETYDDGTDTGMWVASFNVPREILATGGCFHGRGVPNGAFLQQANFSSSIPTWSTASPRFQPGNADQYKEDSVFVGDWFSAGIRRFSARLKVIHAGNWPSSGRPLTVQLLQMDQSGFNVKYVATYTTRVFRRVPTGWHLHAFTVDDGAGQMPAGWVFTRGDGTPAQPEEWRNLLSQIDVTSIGYYAPGFAYPGNGSWTLGIDNIRVGTGQPQPADAADDADEEF